MYPENQSKKKHRIRNPINDVREQFKSEIMKPENPSKLKYPIYKHSQNRFAQVA